MGQSHRITLELSEEQGFVQITGDVDTLRKDRRVAMSLRRLDPGYDPKELRINIGNRNVPDLLRALHEALSKRGYEDSDGEKADEALKKFYRQENAFAEFSEKARLIRNNECDAEDFKTFADALAEHLPGRSLYQLQLLSAYHLAFSQNAANFSVPGAGKTTIVYGAYAFLRNLPDDDIKHVGSLVVVGPLSSFQPWEDEFESCFNCKPTVTRLDGTMSLQDKRNYLLSGKPSDLTLVSYGSLASLRKYLADFLRSHHAMLVVDEAHKIKNTSGGIWATTALSLADSASSRVILTGTPAPNGYEDLFNLFEFIWPHRNVAKFQVNQLSDMSKNEDDDRIPRLLNYIEPYYLRIRKSDLDLPPVVNVPLHLVRMSDLQRKIYDDIEYLFLEGLVGSAFDDDQSRNSAFARITRLMQASSDPKTLLSAHNNPEIDLFLPDDVLESIRLFINTEVPRKYQAGKAIVDKTINAGEKIIVWTHFISTLKSMKEYLESSGIKVKALYGETPTGTYIEGEETDDEDEESVRTREAIIKEFNNPQSDLMVVIANPAAVAESISLHHACHTALYLERGFNAAQYLQSRDRIHRYGLGKDVVTTYHTIACVDTIDEVVDQRLKQKEERMMRIVESSTIPLFDNVQDGLGTEDIKAIIRDYARRTNRI